MKLDTYRALGRSGLIVSPLALGTMTFGTARWGSDEQTSLAVFNTYVEAGGNFVDTADVYAGGRSEEMLGRFIKARGSRDKLVIATKAGFASGKGVHAGGSGARHLHAALEGSLRRLETDFVDLYWLHVWDSFTPAEELLETMTSLVRSGKIRYWGISNAPAWYVAKVATLAAVHAQPPPVALQYFYSLVNRDLEDEHVPLAAEFGLGIVPWSPLAYGLLTGKYDRTTSTTSPGKMRLDGPNPFGNTLFTDRNWKIVDRLKTIASEMLETPAQVALAWLFAQPGVTSTLIGVSRVEQLIENASALDLTLSAAHRATLDAVSAPPEPSLYALFTPALRQQAIFGGATVQRKS